MKIFKGLSFVLIFLLTPQYVFSQEAGTNAVFFNDLPENHSFAEAVNHYLELGLIQGFEDGSMRPDTAINRAEALKLILGFANISQVPGTNASEVFSDVKVEDWFSPYVNAGLEKGIISISEDGLFNPSREVNDVEALKMLYEALQINNASEDTETEVTDGAEWFAKYWNFGEQNNMLIKDRVGKNEPGKKLTRGELLEMYYRYEKNPYTDQSEFGVLSYYGYPFHGRNTASGTKLDAYGHMAAHRTLPFGTKVKVTNIKTNLSTIVTIVDRGPHVDGRILDVTPGAFTEIGALSAGLLHVRMDVIK